MPAEISLLSAIEAIGKLLPNLKSFTGARRREYFEKLLTPLVDRLEDIHTSYNQLFLETRNKIVDLKSANTPFLGNEKVVFTGQPLAELIKTKEEFARLRRTDEHLRDAVRQDAQQDLQKISWTEERRVLVCVALYFLRSGSVWITDSELDREAETVIRVGGLTHWDTPSIALYFQIKDETDPENLLELLDDAVAQLNQRYMNIRRHYRRVANLIIQKT